jgi:hypothetical protein
VTLGDLRFRKGARVICEYDLNIPWCHEARIEDRLEREARKTYLVCTGGDGACPPEDCGGLESFMDHRNDWLSFEAFEDLDTTVEVVVSSRPCRGSCFVVYRRSRASTRLISG